MFSQSTNQVPTRYSDNVNNMNSVINLMFFKPNSLELNNHTIHPELHFSSNHALLTVDITIKKEFVQDKWHTIIKNSEKEENFTSELIEVFSNIDTLYIVNKNALELIVQEYLRILNFIWYKHSQNINITRHSKAWCYKTSVWTDFGRVRVSVVATTYHKDKWSHKR